MSSKTKQEQIERYLLSIPNEEAVTAAYYYAAKVVVLRASAYGGKLLAPGTLTPSERNKKILVSVQDKDNLERFLFGLEDHEKTNNYRNVMRFIETQSPLNPSAYSRLKMSILEDEYGKANYVTLMDCKPVILVDLSLSEQTIVEAAKKEIARRIKKSELKNIKSAKIEETHNIGPDVTHGIYKWEASSGVILAIQHRSRGRLREIENVNIAGPL